MSEYEYDLFFKKPGEIDSISCRVCNAVCEVERDAYKPIWYGPAGSNRVALRDRFKCPHYDTWWHNKARKILQEMDSTASDRLAKLLHDDLIELLADHGIDNEAEWWPRLVRRHR